MTTPTVTHTRPPNRSELDALAAAADLVHCRRLAEPELLRVWHAMARSATSAGMDPSLALVDVLRTTLAAVLTERIEAEDIDRALTDAAAALRSTSHPLFRDQDVLTIARRLGQLTRSLGLPEDAHAVRLLTQMVLQLPATDHEGER